MAVSRREFWAGLAGVAATGTLMGASGAARAQGVLNVVTTTGIVADAARSVAGARAEVTALMGVGVDPHAFRLTRSDVAKLTSSDLVLWHGLHLEAQLTELLGRLAERKSVVAVSEATPTGLLLADPEYSDRYDPHVWMDPRLWLSSVAAARDALIAAAPSAEADFRARYDAYAAEIDAVAYYAEEVLASTPAEARALVTAHDAFGYFGRAYGYEVMGIQGISTESEAGLARIAELVDVLVERRIKAVFVESSVSDRNVRALIEGAAARGHEVSIGGELFSDAMGPEGTYEGTYLGMIDHNATTVARALGGAAPAQGRLGRLGGA